MSKVINIDMRYREILNEFLIQLKNLNITIHRNPIKPQILNLFKDVESLPTSASSLDNTLRGIIVDDKIYVWSAFAAMHSEVIEAIIAEGFVERDRLQKYSGFYLDRGIYDKKILDRGFYSYGENEQIDKAILNKHLDRWNG